MGEDSNNQSRNSLKNYATNTQSYFKNISDKIELNIKVHKMENLSDLDPLSPEKVRWFYKETKTWVPFCGYDSLRLETKFQELKYHKDNNATTESLKEMIVVRGDLFEVDVLKREGFPIYWTAPDEEHNVFLIMRGTWFRDGSWQPLDSEEISDRIEQEHVQYVHDVQVETMELRKSSATEVIAQHLTKKFNLSVRSVLVNEYHVDWYDGDTVYIYMDSASHFIRHKLGLTKVGSRLRRGYKSRAKIDDKLPDINHLIFVIHGIGQKMKGGDIVYQANRLRALSRKVTKRFFPRLDGINQRVEFFPVEWRKLLVLDGNTVDLITPDRNKGLRNAVNSTALDVLYYSSPIYRPEMIESLRSELNRLYSMFCARSPYFEDKGGKVSILAHSLGAVLVYDILTNWSPANIYEYLETLDNTNQSQAEHEGRLNLFSELNQAKENVHRLEMQVLSKAEQQNIKRAETNFREANFPSNFIHGKLWKTFPRLENFFCVGSPLAVFLALRGMKPQDCTSINHILPQELCHRIFNVFHPADPVVYRLEPLINKIYFGIEPVRIHRLDQSHKPPYDHIPLRRSEELDEEPLSDDSSVSKTRFEEEECSTKESSNISSIPDDNAITIAGRFMRFFNKFSAANENKGNGDLTELDKLQVLIITEEQVSKKIQRAETQKESNKKCKLRTVNKKKRKVNFGQSPLSLSVQSLHRRNNAMVSSFRLPKLKQIQSVRQSLRMKAEIFVNSKNSNIIDNYHQQLYPEGLDMSDSDVTLNDSGQESHSSDDTVFEPTLEQPSEVRPQTSGSETPVPPSKELKVRIDFRLPESRYESSYLSVLTSHTGYWSSGELCQFMLTQIFGHLGSAGNPL